MSIYNKKKISIVLGNHPHVQLIKEGRIKSDKIELHFVEYDPVHNAFDPMVQELAFDVCEMAIGTFFQAIDAGKPIQLLPVVMVSKFHHGSLWYASENGIVKPQQLCGKKVGVRAYTQTTGIWVRGVLKEQFGVDSSDITWVTTEKSHVAEYNNPANVIMVQDESMTEMLREGKIDAAIMGPDLKEPGFMQVISEPDKAAKQWFDVHHVIPINHMVVIKEELVREDPEVVVELYRMFKESYELSGIHKTNKAIKIGTDDCWDALSLAMQYSVEQKLLSRVLEREEVFPKAIDESMHLL